MDSDELSDSINEEDSAAEENDPLEECIFGKDVFLVPESFCTQREIFDHVLSIDTWENILNDDHRAKLNLLLPKFPENDVQEKEKTVRKLFSAENFKFGNPVSRVFHLLNEGFLSPEVAPLYASNQMAVYREYKNQQNVYHYRLLRQVLISRKKLLDTANMLPPDEPVKMQQFVAKPKNAILCERTRLRYFSVLQEVREETGELETSSEDENYPESSPPKITRKHKRQLQILEASLSPEMTRVSSTVALPPGHPGSGHFLNRCLDLIEVSDERYREMLLMHKRRKLNEPNHPELNVSKVNLNTMIAKANLPKRPLLKIDTHSKKRSKCHDSSDKVCKGNFSTNDKLLLDIKPQLHNLKLFPTNSIISNGELHSDIQLPLVFNNLFQQESNAVKVEIKEEPVDDNRISPLPDVPQFPTCFFSLLRDLFCESPEQKLSAAKLEEKVREWQDGPMAIFVSDWLHFQESWPELVSSALKFLAGDLISILPDNFVPFVDYKEKQQQWQWIGTGRDSEEQMSTLCQHWLGNKDHVSLDILETCQGSPPPPRVTTVWTVRATTDEEKSLYWEQERVRYQNPHKAFTFKVHGYESVVGPVKGVYGKESGVNKAREHSLLISDRPPFVTILSLVRDAAARLPNGQGTRADICELLKDSQYLALASDQQVSLNIHTVVSGALDRLHYEKDPCVKYDVNRKLWIYLHRNRTEGEFERIHQAQAAAAKARRAVQKNKPPKSKCKDVPRTTLPTSVSTTEERVAALLNVEVAATVSPTPTAHSPRGGMSPRTQGSPKQSHPISNRQLLRQLSAANQSHNKGASSLTSDITTLSRKSEISQVNLVSSSLGHPVVPPITSGCSPQHSIPSGILSHLHSEGNNSRPPSQGSVQSLPSPKTVIANVNAAQFVSVGSLQVGPTSSEQAMSSGAVTPCLGVLSVDMKPSSPSFVGQPPVLQPVLSHQTIVTTSLSCISTAVAPSYVPSVTGSAPKSSKLISAPSTSKALPSFQTIVIKPDTSGRSTSGLSSLPLLSVDDLPSGESTVMNNPMVTRLLHGSQLLSLGNLMTSNVPGTVLKQGNSTLQNFKIQGTEFVQQVIPTSNVNLFPSTASSEIKIPRLALVSQESNVQDPTFISSAGMVGQSAVFQQRAFPSAETKVSSAHKELPEIKRVTIGSQTQRQTSSDISQFLECGNMPNQVAQSLASSSSSSSCSTHSLQPSHSKGSSVVIATQDNLKPLTSTYLMTTPITNASLITTPHGLRTTNPLSVRALQGIKVIPVAQSLGSNKNLRSTPLLARIISPSAGLALRSGVPSELVHTTHHLKGGTTMNILHGLQSVTASPHLIRTGTHLSSSQEVPNNQPFIIQVQAPKNTDEDPNL